jgi:hypothetical protein
MQIHATSLLCDLFMSSRLHFVLGVKGIVERVRFPSLKDIDSALMVIMKMNGNNFLHVLGAFRNYREER